MQHVHQRGCHKLDALHDVARGLLAVVVADEVADADRRRLRNFPVGNELYFQTLKRVVGCRVAVCSRQDGHADAVAFGYFGRPVLSKIVER